jgi:predicted secreted Zn-dependent protease
MGRSTMASGVVWAGEITWRKASFCGGGECVEVGQHDGLVVMRDSKQPAGNLLRYTSEEWRAFVNGVKAGEFDNLG